MVFSFYSKKQMHNEFFKNVIRILTWKAIEYLCTAELHMFLCPWQLVKLLANKRKLNLMKLRSYGTPHVNTNIHCICEIKCVGYKIGLKSLIEYLLLNLSANQVKVATWMFKFDFLPLKYLLCCLPGFEQNELIQSEY